MFDLRKTFEIEIFVKTNIKQKGSPSGRFWVSCIKKL